MLHRMAACYWLRALTGGLSLRARKYYSLAPARWTVHSTPHLPPARNSRAAHQLSTSYHAFPNSGAPGNVVVSCGTVIAVQPSPGYDATHLVTPTDFGCPRMLIFSQLSDRVNRISGDPLSLSGSKVTESVLPRVSLSLASILNIQADQLATAYRGNGSCVSSTHVPHIDEQQCSISINGVWLTSQYDECARFHVNGYHLKQYAMSSNGWSNNVWNEIYFAVFGAHFRRLRPSQQASHMKLVHNQLPLGERRYQQAPIKEDSLRLCPRCKEKSETNEHFLQCEANPARLQSLSKLKSDIQTTDIHPVRYLLFAGICHWLKNPDTLFDPSTSEFPEHLLVPIQEALSFQARIGWHQAVKGYFSKNWAALANMDMYHPTATDQQKGTMRMRSIIQSVQLYTTQTWKYRNSALHDTDDTTATQIRSSEATEI